MRGDGADRVGDGTLSLTDWHEHGPAQAADAHGPRDRFVSQLLASRNGSSSAKGYSVGAAFAATEADCDDWEAHDWEERSSTPPAQPPAVAEHSSAVRLCELQSTPVPLTSAYASTQVTGTHHVDLDEARASDLHQSTCARACREKHGSTPQDRGGEREQLTEGE